MKKEIELETLREAAKRKVEKDECAFRSCWNCNAAHEYMKEWDTVISCFECGHWYFMGVDITEKD